MTTTRTFSAHLTQALRERVFSLTDTSRPEGPALLAAAGTMSGAAAFIVYAMHGSAAAAAVAGLVLKYSTGLTSSITNLVVQVGGPRRHGEPV